MQLHSFGFSPPNTSPIFYLSPKFRRQVSAAAIKVCASEEMSMVCALAAMAFASQRLITITAEPDRPMRCMLSFIGIGLSGEGKTAYDQIFLKTIKNFEVKRRELFNRQLRHYEAKKEAFKARHKAITRAMRVAAKDDEDQLGQLTEELDELLETHPKKPRIFRCLFENATPAALTRGVVENGCVAVMSHEGINAIKSGIFSDPGLLNAGYDGSHYCYDRVGYGSHIVPSVMIALFVTMQPNVFTTLAKKKGELLKDVGTFNRALFYWPETKIGNRSFLPSADPKGDERALNEFDQRIMELVNRAFPENDGLPPESIAMTLSIEAGLAWKQYRAQAEVGSQPKIPGGDPDTYLARSAQNVARIAAVLTFFLEGATVVSLETMQQAIRIVEWFIDQHQQIFHPYERPQEEQDALEMLDWLQGECRDDPSMTHMPVQRVMNSGPNSLRLKHMSRPALRQLECWNHLHFVKLPKPQAINVQQTRLTEYIDVRKIQHFVHASMGFPNGFAGWAPSSTDWLSQAISLPNPNLGLFTK